MGTSFTFLPVARDAMSQVSRNQPQRHPTISMPVAPVAYQVILEPGIGQFHEFEPPRVRTRINS